MQVNASHEAMKAPLSGCKMSRMRSLLWSKQTDLCLASVFYSSITTIAPIYGARRHDLETCCEISHPLLVDAFRTTVVTLKGCVGKLRFKLCATPELSLSPQYTQQLHLLKMSTLSAKTPKFCSNLILKKKTRIGHNASEHF